MKQRLGVLIVGCALAACAGKGNEGESGNTEAGAGNDTPSGGTSSTHAGGGQGGIVGMDPGNEGGAGPSSEGGDGNVVTAPPAQGAFLMQVGPAAPQPAGKACPSVTFTSTVPDTSDTPPETLSETNYMQKVIDGEEGASFSCRVAETGSDGWIIEAEIFQSGRGLRIESGMLSAEAEGTATITITDSPRLSGSLTSAEPCTVTAMQGPQNNFQIKAGSTWGRFNCAAVESPPVNSCTAKGIFVLENCAQN